MSDTPMPQPAEVHAANEKQADAASSPEAARIEQLTAELAQMREQWIRAAAETENVRKRAQREQEETSKYAITGFARDMVSVLENLMRASESISPQQRAQNELLRTLGEGVELTLKELLGIFERYHIRRVDPMGEKFDHQLHQAVVQVERADVPAGTVVQVVQAGYLIHDRLLRPAMVAVAKQAAPAKPVDTTA
jgi:molecular chaperone GrpE